MTSTLLLFHTARHLRWEQVVFRIVARLRKIDATPVPALQAARWRHAWDGPVYKASTLEADGAWQFLSESHRIERAADWNNPDWSKLWLYNLHYFDDLDAVGATQRVEQHAQWVTRWIDENPAPLGNGWEPYPLSLRIVNWVKWLTIVGKTQPKWLDSLALQVSVLSQRLEYHLLGNHLWANAKALIFAGAFFSGQQAQRWLKKGLDILEREIREQFLPDGGHFELSPMYHATLLWDLLELLELARCTDLPELRQREALWREYASRALTWLAAMCHGDGEISFFNDAAFDIAPAPARIQAFAHRLGLTMPVDPIGANEVVRVHQLASTGYVRVDWRDAHAILDVAQVGPDYLPGHAHADTLSFEWSLGGQRVFVNSGTSQYGNDAERQRQRGTVAHNTVAIAAADSSEVWAGFRVARRAYPKALVVDASHDEASIGCGHDGYRRLKGRPMHRREWRANAGQLTITDTVTSRAEDSVAYFHLHPDVRATKRGDDGVELELKDGRIVHVRFEAGEPALSPNTWHPRFGETQASTCIVVPFQAARLVTTVNW